MFEGALPPCPFLLQPIKTSQTGWPVPPCDVSNGAMMTLLPPDAPLGPMVCDNYHPVTNMSFLGKVLEIVRDVQMFWEEADYRI